jgi:Bacterial Ig-like domain (group 3)/Invasin, domain 3
MWAAAGSAAAPLAQAPSRAKHIALTLQPTTIIANGSSSATATAKVTDGNGDPVPGDKVEFSSSDPGQSILDVTNHGNGTYTALIRSSTTPGTATITARDTTAGISAVLNLIQTAASSGLSLVAFPSAVVTNQTVTLIATVSSTLGSASGTITFTNAQGAPLAGCISQPVTPTNPVALCQVTFAASTSPDLLKAAFSANPSSHVASTSAVATVTVGRDSTSTSVEAIKTVQSGSPTTYVATVSPPTVRPGPVVPSGSVEFFDGGQPIGPCVAQTLTNGQATCTVTYNSTGAHSITAGYGGDSNFVGSASPSEQVSVVPAPVSVLGIIDATMQWSFAFAPTYTDVLSLVVNGASPGSTVLVNCHGRGCPFKKRAIAVTKTNRCGPKGERRCLTHGRVDLTPALGNHRLRVGTRIRVEIVRRGWIGRYYMFSVRSRRGPQIQIACLAPGGSRPGVGC